MKKTLLVAMILSTQIAFAKNMPCGGQDGSRHPNGGGFVANTAKVSAKVFVGPNASVCAFANITDQSFIDNNAEVSSHATVGGNSKISGNALVEDGLVTDNANIYSDAYICSDRIVGEVTTDICNPWGHKRGAALSPTNVSDGARDNSTPSYESLSTNTQKNNSEGISR